MKPPSHLNGFSCLHSNPGLFAADSAFELARSRVERRAEKAGAIVFLSTLGRMDAKTKHVHGLRQILRDRTLGFLA